jgi:hypothetical protein
MQKEKTHITLTLNHMPIVNTVVMSIEFVPHF